MILVQVIFPAILLLVGEVEAGEAVPWYRDPRWRIVNLVIFIAFLVYILVKKIKIGEVFDRRADGIRKQLEQARREKEEAERRLAEVETRLARLDEEVSQIKAQNEAESAREHDRIMKGAATDADKIGQTAQRELEGAMKAAKSELRAFVAEQSVQLAEAMIRADLRADDAGRLLDKYIDELPGVKP